jgi:FkbM family methyltransferase
MTKFTINGIEFNVGDGECGDFGCFNEGSAQATDIGPFGMIQEMRAFIRIQDERKLRNLVDVGALFGVFSLVFTRYPDATAYAIEPSEPAFNGLLNNVLVNPDRHIIPLFTFAGEFEGEPIGCGVEWKHVVARRFPDSPRVLYYPQRRLDLMDSIKKVDCIKIDVEGFECPVLRGAVGMIKKWKPIIFLECHFSVLPEVSGDSNASLFDLIRSMGYTVNTFQGETVGTFEGLNGCRYVLEPER